MPSPTPCRASSRAAPAAIPLSYEVFGKRYFVLATAEGYRERGVASWYGPDFHARPTSSGEPYDMYAMTAAHKTLPIPAYARVTNLANGRSVVVRINDRGPFVGNRIIDLSYTAAHKLDMTQAGTAFVEVEVITPGSLAEAARGIAPRPAPPAALAAACSTCRPAPSAWRPTPRNWPSACAAPASAMCWCVQPDATALALYRVRVGPDRRCGQLRYPRRARSRASAYETRLVSE